MFGILFSLSYIADSRSKLMNLFVLGVKQVKHLTGFVCIMSTGLKSTVSNLGSIFFVLHRGLDDLTAFFGQVA
jgi:hypothetical protein